LTISLKTPLIQNARSRPSTKENPAIEQQNTLLPKALSPSGSALVRTAVTAACKITALDVGQRGTIFPTFGAVTARSAVMGFREQLNPSCGPLLSFRHRNS
jgi:hypothetical protein